MELMSAASAPQQTRQQAMALANREYDLDIRGIAGEQLGDIHLAEPVYLGWVMMAVYLYRHDHRCPLGQRKL